VDRTLPVSDDTRSLVAFVFPLIFVENVEVHENLNEQHVDIIPSSNASP